MPTATCLRHLDNWIADAYEFALSEPLRGVSTVIVSALVPDHPDVREMDQVIAFAELFGGKVAPDGQPGDHEVLIFGPPANESSPALVLHDEGGQSCGMRGTLDHAEALAKYGYTTEWDGKKV